MCGAANFEEDLGVIAACQAVGLQFNSTVSAGVGSLFLGTNLILPRSRSPPQVLRHCFPGLVPSGHRYCYSIYGRRQVIPSYTTHKLRVTGKLYLRIQPINFEVRFLKWHAAGEIPITLLSQDSRCWRRSPNYSICSRTARE